MYNHKALTAIALLLFGVALVTPLSAVADQNCDPSLFKTLTKGHVSEKNRLFFLQVIDKSLYSTIKKENGAAANIVVKSIPIKATSSYAQFRDLRKEEFELINFTFDSAFSRDYIASRLDADGLSAYIACLRGTTGLTAWIAPGTSVSDVVSIHIAWRPVNYRGKRKLKIEFSGLAAGEPASKSLTLVDGGEVTITIHRDKDKEFRATLNLDNAYSDVVSIPPEPIMIKTTVERDIELKGTITTERTENHCLKASRGWSLLPNTVGISPPGIGGPRPWGARQTTVNKSRACYQIWLSRYASDPTSIEWNIFAKEKGTVKQYQ